MFVQLRQYPVPDLSLEWIRLPFASNQLAVDESSLSETIMNSLVEWSSDGSLRALFSGMNLTEFWLHVRNEFATLSNIAIKHLLPFLCEVAFSTLVGLKTVKRNRLNVEADLRLKVSNTEPNIRLLVREHGKHHASH